MGLGAKMYVRHKDHGLGEHAHEMLRGGRLGPAVPIVRRGKTVLSTVPARMPDPRERPAI